MSSAKQDLVLLSGGLDSAVLAHKLKLDVSSLRAIYIDTGFLSTPAELGTAKAIAHKLDIHVEIVRAPGLSEMVAAFYPPEYYPQIDWDKSRPLDPVPKQQYVSGFHVLVAIASFYAMLSRHLVLHVAIIKEQVRLQPGLDNFLDSWCEATKALNPERQITVKAPFKDYSKAQVIKLGREVGADLARTWSCYGYGPTHCGRCGGCLQRRDGFAESEVDDLTSYAG